MFQLILKHNPSQSQLSTLKSHDESIKINVINDEINLFCSPLSLNSIKSQISKFEIPYRIVGSPNALVCIFEFFQGVMGWPEKFSKGLMRISELGRGKLDIDTSVSNLKPGTYQCAIHEFGDLSQGPKSAGPILKQLQNLEIKDSNQTMNFNLQIQGELHDLIGRSVCISNSNDFACGILARSAGVFENKKRVCDCSGKTIWEE